MKITINALLLLICLFVLSGPVFSQKAWEKPFQKWSREDSIKILTNSPWALMFQAEETSGAGIRQQRSEIQAARSGGNNPGSAARSFGFAPIIARLYSGLPVRQALIRLRQIQAGYDKMDEKKRAGFDEANKGLMNCPICKNYYVVSLAKNIDTSQGIEDGIFQTMKLEDLKGNVKLINDKGEERELIQFVPPKNTNDIATLFFARKGEKGDLFLTPENKKFKLVFGDILQDNKNPYAKLLPRSFEFVVSKILVNENLEF